jgi:4-carboxymuconolactone decarboxylase
MALDDEPRGRMNDESRWVWDMVDLAAAQAAGDMSGMDGAFGRLRADGREKEVEEALLQSYLFLGFPSVVYGDHYERLRENIARFHPDLDRWMVMEGYGKVLARPALGLDVRELLIVAMLVVQGQSGRRQLRSHLMGALNAGASRNDVETTIERAALFAPPGNLQLAWKLWSAVLGRP